MMYAFQQSKTWPIGEIQLPPDVQLGFDLTISDAIEMPGCRPPAWDFVKEGPAKNCSMSPDCVSCIGDPARLDLYRILNRYNIMRVVNFSDARNSLKSIIDQVSDDADYTVITRRDASDAVVMSLDTFNSLMETVHLLKSPANAAHLARSIGQYRKGKVKARELVDA